MYTLDDKICILFAENGITNAKYFAVRNLFDSAEQLVNQIFESKDCQKILGANYNELCRAIFNKAWDNVIAEMDKNGVVVVSCYSDKYPVSLSDIDDMPYALFCKGDVNLLKSRCLAVVGTRKASAYGRRVAKDFTQVLCDHFTVVSGLAYGVDSIAHDVTLQNNGKTIAVFGSGVLNVYPSANEQLAKRIVDNGGLLVSEYGLHGEPLAYHFPYRNRIVSGLSQGLLVCQAPAKSGTSSTVELALEQGKDVFVVPGEIYDAGFTGSNSLIKSMQGACVTSPRDIEDFYGINDVKNEQKVSYQLDFEEQVVVNALSDGQLSLEQLVVKTQIAPAQLIILLANLELRSIIAKLPGNWYRLHGGLE